MVDSVPFSSFFDLWSTEHSTDVVLEPAVEERAAIAEWLGVLGLEALTAKIHIERKSHELYLYDASFEADVVQACVVTLEPVRAHLSGAFHRALAVPPRSRGRRADPEIRAHEIAISFDDAEEPETLSSSKFDVAAPVLEELGLALDPYPKAPGAILTVTEDAEDRPKSPFAVLENLRHSGPDKAGKDEKTPHPGVKPVPKA